jgi:dipeptidyl aminopeptidase/acylaminoacyl peptidase
MRRLFVVLAGLFAMGAGAACVEAQQPFTLQQVLSAPYALELTAAPVGGEFAWVENAEGVRNIWVGGKGEVARQVTHYTEDDGQDVGGLAWSPDASAIAYSYGAGSGADGKPANPAHLQRATPVVVMVQPVAGGAAVSLGEGHSPLWLKDGRELLFVRGGQIWIAPLAGKVKAVGESKDGVDELPVEDRRIAMPFQLVFDRGSAGSLTLSPDGGTLAFVSRRKGHGFLGLFDLKTQTLRFVGASTGSDFAPSFSPEGKQIAWLRKPFEQVPEYAVNRVSANPWAIEIADVATGVARTVYMPEANKPGSVLPHLASEEPRVLWLSGGRIGFFSEADGWVHLYSLDLEAKGTSPVLLTPGKGDVEGLVQGKDGALVWASNVPVCKGGDPKVCDLQDADRRHLWRMGSNGAEALTSGEGMEMHPEIAADGRVGAMVSDASRPMGAALISADGVIAPLRAGALPSGYPVGSLVVPQEVSFEAEDGVRLHGQLFLPGTKADSSAALRNDNKKGNGRAAIVFFHGGPKRQMLLGYPGMDYYSNAYAMNQYLASLGFVVLSVNYRGGIGYGTEFRQAEKFGPYGASEYKDALAAVKWLRSRVDMDAKRIGAWGGSYGGYLTALALARNSDLFAAGVDFHGVHDWNLEDDGTEWAKGSNAENDASAALARASSPIADVGKWRSPVLLIHGDDDPEVNYAETPMLAEALRARGVEVEGLIFPDEVHDFLLHKDWVKAYEVEARFFVRELKP